MVSDFDRAQIVVLRGLGYRQGEIAEKLGLTIGQVNYHLAEINKESEERGVTATYMKVLSAGYGPQITQLIEAVQKISK